MQDQQPAAAPRFDELHGQSAIVTGASRGIGAATAHELARHGMRVLLLARSADAIEQQARAIRDAGGDALAQTCDVASYPDVEAAVFACRERFGSVDVLVNNAGLIEPIARLDDSAPDKWGHTLDVNVKGPYHGIRAVLPVMTEQRHGTIVNISSGAATGAYEAWSHYCAAKAALLSLTKCTHIENAEHGIRSIGLNPGSVQTDMQGAIRDSGINPVSQRDWSEHIPPEWPARAVAWLCTEAAAPFAGDDYSIKTEAGRRRVGLID